MPNPEIKTYVVGEWPREIEDMYQSFKKRLIEELVAEKRHGLDGQYVECFPLVDKGKT